MLHRALHADRVVVVNPSVYGTDNPCTLDAVKQLGSSARLHSSCTAFCTVSTLLTQAWARDEMSLQCRYRE